MTPESDEPLRRIVNASGFAFQMAVADLVERNLSEARWRVASSEHGWSGEDSQGYIDLILEALTDSGYRLVMVVECKRNAAPAWVFQVPDSAPQDTARARCRSARVGAPDGREDVLQRAWGELHLAPRSPEAVFCSVRGDGDKREMMIERLAGRLLDATEALMREETDLPGLRRDLRPSIYLPAIVTNAPLSVCRFDPANVSMEDGKLPLGASQFTIAPLVRFRKSLATTLTIGASPLRLSEANEDRERTVFVINSSTMLETLRAIAQTRDPWT